MLTNSPEWQRSVRNNDLIAMRGMLMTRSPSPRRLSNAPSTRSQYYNYSSASVNSRYDNNGGGGDGNEDPTYLKPSQRDEGSMLFESNGQNTTRGKTPHNLRKGSFFVSGAKDATSSSGLKSITRTASNAHVDPTFPHPSVVPLPHGSGAAAAAAAAAADASSPFLLDADAKVAYYKSLLKSKQEIDTEKATTDSKNGEGASAVEGKVHSSSEDQEREEASSVAAMRRRHRVFEERFGGGAQQSETRSSVVSPERKAYTAFSERRDRIVGASSLASSQAASDALKHDTRPGHNKAASYGAAAAPRSLLDFALADQLGLNTVPNSSLSKQNSNVRQSTLPSSSRGFAILDSRRDGHHALPSSVRALALAAAEAEAQRERYRFKILNNGVSPSREHTDDEDGGENGEGEENERGQRIAFSRQDYYHSYETPKHAPHPSGSNAVAVRKKASSSIAEEAMRAVNAAAAGVLSYHPDIADPTPKHSFYPTTDTTPSSARNNHNNKGHLHNNNYTSSSVTNTNTNNHALSLTHSSSLTSTCSSDVKEKAGILRYKSEFAAVREAERQRELYYQRRVVISPETAAAMIATGQDESFERECLIEVEHQEWRRLMIIAGDDCEAQMAKLRLRERKALFDKEAEERVVLADQYSVSYSHLLHFVKRLEALQWPFSLLHAKERQARETIHVIEERYRRDLMSSLELLAMGSDSVVDTLRKAKLIMQSRLLSTADEKLVGSLVTRAESDADRAGAMQRALEYDNAVRAAMRFVSPIRGGVGTENGVDGGVGGDSYDLRHDHRHHDHNNASRLSALRQATGHTDDNNANPFSYPPLPPPLHHHSNNSYYYPNGLRFFSESGNEVNFEDIIAGSGVGGDADLRALFGRGGTTHNTTSRHDDAHHADALDRFRNVRKREERPIEERTAAVVWGSTFQYGNPTQHQDEASPARPFYFPESGASGSADFVTTTKWRPEASITADRSKNKTEREQEVEVDSVAKELLAERFAFEESSRMYEEQEYRKDEEEMEEKAEKEDKRIAAEHHRQEEMRFGGGGPKEATKTQNPATTQSVEDVHRNTTMSPSPNYSPLLLSETREVALIFSSPTSDTGDFRTEVVQVRKGDEEEAVKMMMDMDMAVSESHHATPFGYYASPSPPPHPETQQRDRDIFESNNDDDYVDRGGGGDLNDAKNTHAPDSRPAEAKGEVAEKVKTVRNKQINTYEETSSSSSSSSSSPSSSVAARGKSTVSLVIEEEQHSEASLPPPPQQPSSSASQHEHISSSAAGGDAVVLNSFYSSYSHRIITTTDKSLDTEEKKVHPNRHEEEEGLNVSYTKANETTMAPWTLDDFYTTMPAATRKLKPQLGHTTDTMLPFSSSSSSSNSHPANSHDQSEGPHQIAVTGGSSPSIVVNITNNNQQPSTDAATTQLMPSSPTPVALDQERDRVLRNTFVSMLASQGTKLEEILREQRALSAERQRMQLHQYSDADEDTGGAHQRSPRRLMSSATPAEEEEDKRSNTFLSPFGEQDVVVRERDSSVKGAVDAYKTDKNANRTARRSEGNGHDNRRSQEGATDSEAEVAPPPDANNTSTRPPTPSSHHIAQREESNRNDNTEKRPPPFTAVRQQTQTKNKNAIKDWKDMSTSVDVVTTNSTNSDLLLLKEQSLRISSYAEAIHRLAKEHRAKKDSTTLQHLSSQPAANTAAGTAVSRSASTTAKTATRTNEDTRRSQEHAHHNNYHQHQRRRQNESSDKNTDDAGDNDDQQVAAASAIGDAAPQKTHPINQFTSLPKTPRKHQTSASLRNRNGSNTGDEYMYVEKVRGEVPSLPSSRSGTPTISYQSRITATTPTNNTRTKGNTLRNPRQSKHREEQQQLFEPHLRPERASHNFRVGQNREMPSEESGQNTDQQHFHVPASVLRPKTPSRAASFFASATREISSTGPSSARASRTASIASSSAAGRTAPIPTTTEDGVKHVAAASVTPPRIRLLDTNAAATPTETIPYKHYYYHHSTLREDNAMRVSAETSYFAPTATSTSTSMTTRTARYFEEQYHQELLPQQILEPVRPLPFPETLAREREEQEKSDFSPTVLHHSKHPPVTSTSSQRAPIQLHSFLDTKAPSPSAAKIFGRKSAATSSATATAHEPSVAVRQRRGQSFSLQTDFLTIADDEGDSERPQRQQEYEKETRDRKSDEGLFSGANVMSSPQRQRLDRQHEKGNEIAARSQDNGQQQQHQRMPSEPISFGSPLLSSHHLSMDGDNDSESGAPHTHAYWWQDRRRF